MTLAALRQVVEGDPRDWRTVAQVAVEAVANDPSAYDPATRRLVAEVGRKAGVARMYLDLLAGTVVYRAANGHLMEYDEDPDRPGHPARGAAWQAWCAEGCQACAEGDPLPDW